MRRADMAPIANELARFLGRAVLWFPGDVGMKLSIVVPDVPEDDIAEVFAGVQEFERQHFCEEISAEAYTKEDSEEGRAAHLWDEWQRAEP